MRSQAPFFGIFLMAVSAPAGEKAAKDPIRIKIATAKTAYPFRGSIPLTITYTNTSDETVVLAANGVASGEGSPGERFEIGRGDGKKTYAIEAIDPGVQEIKLKPGKSCKRTLKELPAELCRTGVLVDGKSGADMRPLPDPFGRSGEYTIQVRYGPTVRKLRKPYFSGNVKSNVLKVKVVLR